MPLPPKVAKATKRFNPWALRMSAHVPPWSTLHHVGRKSGRAYQVPVMSFAVRAPVEVADGASASVTVAADREILVVHPLPWGSDVDWCRNIRAAGEYTITRAGTDYRVDQVRVLDGDEVLDLLGPATRAAVRLFGAHDFVAGRLRRLPRS